MPHINRIRVNNVKYNFGTQFYDDFIDGKAIQEMAAKKVDSLCSM